MLDPWIIEEIRRREEERRKEHERPVVIEMPQADPPERGRPTDGDEPQRGVVVIDL